MGDIKEMLLASTTSKEDNKKNKKSIAGTAVGFGAGLAVNKVSQGGRALQQSINIATGNINPAQIVKYLLIFVLIMGIGILLIQFGRSVLLAGESMACNVQQIGCDWFGGACRNCDPASPTNVLASNFAFWQFEWILRDLLYLGLAYTVLILCYIWGTWLMDKLLRIDKYIAMIDDWIFGTQFEGEAERQIDQRF